MKRTLAVNASILLTDRPLADRLTAVKSAGFTQVEFWWPFTDATPAEREVEDFIVSIERSGLELIALNLFAGDMPAGDRGIVSWIGRETELAASTEVALTIAHRLGTRHFNALYGNRQPQQNPDEQNERAVANLRTVAHQLATIGATVLLEPVSGAPHYPLRTAADVLEVIDRVSAPAGPRNLGLLLDVYHLAVNGDDVPTVIEQHKDRIKHVQIADAPGRGAPGSGTLPLLEWMQQLRHTGYSGPIALEYTNSSGDPLAAVNQSAWEGVA